METHKELVFSSKLLRAVGWSRAYNLPPSTADAPDPDSDGCASDENRKHNNTANDVLPLLRISQHMKSVDADNFPDLMDAICEHMRNAGMAVNLEKMRRTPSRSTIIRWRVELGELAMLCWAWEFQQGR